MAAVTMSGAVQPQARRWPWITVAIVIACLVVSSSACNGPYYTLAAASPGPPRYPVILVHGLGGDPSAWAGSPLPDLLRQAGYVPDQTLFVLDYGAANDGDYTAIYREYLMPAIDRAKAAAGTDQVDLVAFSMGGLVSRYYVHSPDYRGDVRTLVLLASPTRGSFAASLVRGWFETDVQLHWPEPYRDRPEHVYVRSRVADYAALADRFRLAVRGPLFNRTRTLLDWTRAAEPEFFEQMLVGSQQPIVAGLTPYGEPTPAAGLTGAFYELLAAQTAVALAERPPLQTWSPLTVTLPTLAYTLDPLINEGDVIHWAVAALGAFGLDAGSDAIDRMIDEFSPAGSELEVLTNAFLFDWNESLAAARGQMPRPPGSPFRGVRQVIIAGSMLNLWAPFRAGTGANDGVVAVASTILPTERDDRFRLFSGPALHHLQIKRSRPVAAYVLAALLDEFQPAASWAPAPPGFFHRLVRRGQPVETNAQLSAGYWEPTYLEIRPPSDDSSGTLQLTATLPPATARTGSVAVWAHIERHDGTWETRDLLYPGSLAARASLRLPGFGADAVRVLLGVRRQLPHGDLTRLAVAGASPVTVHAAASYSADGSTVTPPPPSPLVAPAPSPPPLLGSRQRGPAAGLVPHPDAVVDAGGNVNDVVGAGGDAVAGSDRTNTDRGSPGPASAHTDLPVITVERTNRLTTAWKEDITAHASWTWDFGDGTVGHDPDPAHIRSTVHHTFSAPGTYTITATATSNKGDTIRRQTFTVAVAEGGETHTFTAESAQPPQVAFTLSGPKSWLVGHTAPFSATASVAAPPHGEVTGIRFDPGEEFLVLWKRPNHFQVLAAVRVDVTYRWPEGGTFKLRNTYVRKQMVEVMATGLSR